MSKKNLLEFKNERGISNQELARFLGVSNVRLSMILSGQKVPSRQLAYKISDKTCIHILKLLFPQKEAQS